MIKRLFSIIIIPILLLTTITACRNNEDGSTGPDNEDRQKSEHPSIFDEYIYIAQNGYRLLDTGNAESIGGLILHGDLIFYIYNEYTENAVIQVRGIDRSWTIKENITIHTNLPFNTVSVLGFDINNNDEILIILQDFDYENSQNTIYYTKYNFNGELLLQEELLQSGFEWKAVGIHFDKTGFFAITGISVSGFEMQVNYNIHLWDDNLSYLREETTIWGAFTFDNEGAFLRLTGDNPLTLEKVDLKTGSIINECPLSLDYVSNIYLSEENSRFDYYFLTTQYLYGFCTDIGEPELVLDFLESGISLGQNYFLQFLTDGSVAVCFTVMDIQTFSMRYELTILSPVKRAETIDTDEVVLAGFRFRPVFVDQVIEYNRKNPDRQITLRDYFDTDSDWDYEGGIYRPAIERFHFDILSGKAPDIILIEDLDSPDLVAMRDSMIIQNYLADMYPLIDADPVLSREDFFPRILKGYEDKTGKLPVIYSRFGISTMITVDSSLKPETWTIDSFLTLMENNIASGMNQPLGSSVTGADFLFKMLERIGDTFVDFDKGESYFDTANFIRLLKLTEAIPQAPPPDFRYDLNYQELFTGKQVVDLAYFWEISGWVAWEHYGYAPAGFKYDFLGNPGTSGAVHSAQFPCTYSIFENSQNKDAAWQFVREILLPGAEYNEFWKRVTLRIDDFEDSLAAVSMTDAQRNTVREIVHNTTVHEPLSGTILMIIAEEITPFLRGTRTAEDTARIIQSRASIYVSEQS